jgi:hypothetical protein
MDFISFYFLSPFCADAFAARQRWTASRIASAFRVIIVRFAAPG